MRPRLRSPWAALRAHAHSELVADIACAAVESFAGTPNTALLADDAAPLIREVLTSHAHAADVVTAATLALQALEADVGSGNGGCVGVADTVVITTAEAAGASGAAAAGMTGGTGGTIAGSAPAGASEHNTVVDASSGGKKQQRNKKVQKGKDKGKGKGRGR